MAKDKSKAMFECRYGNVNIGDKTASVGVTINRANLTVTQADKTFCMKRLKCKLLARSNGAQAAQESLPGVDDDYVLKGVADVGGFRAGGKEISMTFTFALNSIKVEELSHLAKREGKVTIEATEDLDEKETPKEGS